MSEFAQATHYGNSYTARLALFPIGRAMQALQGSKPLCREWVKQCCDGLDVVLIELSLEAKVLYLSVSLSGDLAPERVAEGLKRHLSERLGALSENSWLPGCIVLSEEAHNSPLVKTYFRQDPPL